MPFGRLEYLKSNAFIDAQTNVNDEVQKLLLIEASDIIEGLVGRRLLRTTYTNEYWIGDDSRRWYPEHIPIITIASIRYQTSGAGIGGTAYAPMGPMYVGTAQIGFRYILYQSAGDWQHNLERSVGVSQYEGGWHDNVGYLLNYDAGFDDTGWDVAAATVAAILPIPSELEWACCDMAHKMWLQGTHMHGSRRGLLGVNRGAESMTYEKFSNLISPEVEMIIDKWRRPI